MWPIVTDQVAWSDGLSVTVVSHAKTAEAIEILFGMRTGMSLRNRVLDGGSASPVGRVNFKGEGTALVKYCNSLP